ncbi:MAG: hypothetical protein WDO13_04485 [Verrucomicrobiota bacterium]
MPTSAVSVGSASSSRSVPRDRRVEALQVHAGGDAAHPRPRHAQLRDQPVGDALAGGDHVVRQRAKRHRAPEPVRVIDLDVPRADQHRPQGQPRGQAGEPAVVGAVRVHHVNPVENQPCGEPYNLERQQRLVRAQRVKAEARLARAPRDRAVRMRRQRDPVAPRAHPFQLCKHANLLPAPAQ